MVWHRLDEFERWQGRNFFFVRATGSVAVAKCQDLDGDGMARLFVWHSTTFSVICGWNNRCRVPVFSGIGPRLKKNTAPFRYARVLPRLEKHRYEIRILVFIRVLLDELRCSIRRTREFHRDDAKETLFLRFEAARGRRFLWFRSPLSLIIDNISKCVSSCVIFANIAITEMLRPFFLCFLFFFFFFSFSFSLFFSSCRQLYVFIYMKI